jgi:peptide/nickel transport system substrate-binding protein
MTYTAQSRRRPGRWLVASLSVVVAAAACGTAASPSPGVSSPASSPGASAAPSQPTEIPRGGTIRYVTFAEPATLNPRMLPEAIADQVGELVHRGLSELDQNGNVYAELAEKIPDPADGDVSADLLTVTWKLREGLRWSDGTPLTSDDLRYTWEVCGNPANGCAKSDGLVDIESVDTPDDRTIVLHYRKPYFDYKLQFRYGILPRNCADCGAPSDVARWRYSQTVNPNLGPFSIVEWRPGDFITLKRNEHFYLASEGKPYLDGVTVLLRDSIETFRQMILTGQADISPWLTQPAPAQVQELLDKGFRLGSGSSPYFNRFQLNLTDPKDRSKPHPILGDVNVRKAIILGTNTENVIFNWNVPGIYQAKQNPYRFSMHGAEYTCDIQPTPYDPDEARRLLDAAGWVPGSDGVRVKDGQRLRLRVSTYTGFGQEDNVVVWIDELRKLGIDAVADPIEVTTFYSSWADGSPVFRGDFDLLYYDWGKDFGGAHQEAFLFYHSTMIPSATNAIGRNVNGVQDAQVDQWIDEAAVALDVATRNDRYCRIAKRVGQELWAEHWNGLIPNFQMSSPKLKGWKDGEMFVWFGSDAENWYLEP